MNDKKTVDETGKKVHEMVEFEYAGVTYKARKKVDPKVADLIQRGNTLIALERMIGKEPYQKFLDSIDEMDEVNEIYLAFNKAADSGNS